MPEAEYGIVHETGEITIGDLGVTRRKQFLAKDIHGAADAETKHHLRQPR